MPPAVSDLVAELNALAEASASALEQLHRGDDAGVREMVERRERLLGLLAQWPLEASATLTEAARRALALDTDIVASLRARQEQLGRQLEGVTTTRRSLQSYGATPSGSALYVERLT